ncbi:MAG TPA: hypothetical protein VNT55_01575, partial [Baekduia sp.]|nr:hypothetical protein [Baekduia sp.]
LDQRTLSNAGTLTHAHGTIRASNGAILRNSATLVLNSEANYWGWALMDTGDGAHPQLVNTASGMVVKNGGTGTTSIGVVIDDAGTIDAQTGAFRFDNSSDPVTLADGATVKGAVQLAGANVTAGDVDGTAADAQLSGGSVTITAGKTLTLRSLTQTGATVAGDGQLTIDGTLTWSNGLMAGSGTTLLDTGATATINPSGDSGTVRLDQRTVLNHGTLTFSSGTLRGSSGAVLRNSARLVANSEANWWGAAFTDTGDGAHPQLVNTAGGTIEKTAGDGTTAIGWAFDHSGTLSASTGRFQLNSDAATLQDGSTISGALSLAGAPVTAGDVDANAAAADLTAGTLAVADGKTMTLGTLTQTGATVGGAGELDIATALTWSNGQMNGSGATVLLSGATGTINPSGDSGSVRLEQRTLSNRGSLTVSRGSVRGARGALWRNSGTLTLNSEANWWGAALVDAFDGDHPQLINTSTGTLNKTSGTGSSGIAFLFDNEGAVDAQSGRLDFSGGGGPSADGTWSASGGSGSSIDFTGGAFTLGAGAQADGAMRVTNGSVAAPDLQLDGPLTISGGTLALTGTGAESHATQLTQSSGTLTGAGALRVTDALTWTGGQMTGAGSTVLDSGATSTIDAPGDSGNVGLDQRTLSNAGTLTLAHGAVRAFNGAVLRNTGTLNANSESTWWGGVVTDVNNGDAPMLVNTATGTIRKAAGTGVTAFGLKIDSAGTIDAQTAPLAFPTSGRTVTLGDGGTLEGVIQLNGAPVSAGDVDASAADLRLSAGSLTTTAGRTLNAGTLRQTGGAIVDGPGTLDVGDLLEFNGGTMRGSGVTDIVPGANATVAPDGDAGNVGLEQRELRIDGSLTHERGTMRLTNAAQITVNGTFTENSEATWFGGPVVDTFNGAHPKIYISPTGSLDKAQGSGRSSLQVLTENQGQVRV